MVQGGEGSSGLFAHSERGDLGELRELGRDERHKELDCDRVGAVAQKLLQLLCVCVCVCVHVRVCVCVCVCVCV